MPLFWWRARVEINPSHRSAFQAHQSTMADCARCHKLFNIRAGVSFIMHLRDEHGMDSDLAIDTVAHLYRKLITKRDEHRRQQHETAQASVPSTGRTVSQ